MAPRKAPLPRRWRHGGADPPPADLARHFVRANQAEKAAFYAFQAGRKADRLYSWDQAPRHYAEARRLWEELGGHEAERALLLERIVKVSFKSVANMGETVELVQQAIALYEQLGDRAKAGRLYALMGREYLSIERQMQMDQDKANEYLPRAQTLLADQPDSPDAIYTDMCLALNYIMLMRTGDAHDVSRKRWGQGDRLRNPAFMLGAGMPPATSLVFQGALAEGWAVLERGWERARRLQRAAVQDLYCAQGERMALTFGDPDLAFAWAARVSGGPTVFAPFMQPEHVMSAHACRGDLREGQRVFDELRRRQDAVGRGCGLHPAFSG